MGSITSPWSLSKVDRCATLTNSKSLSDECAEFLKNLNPSLEVSGYGDHKTLSNLIEKMADYETKPFTVPTPAGPSSTNTIPADAPHLAIAPFDSNQAKAYQQEWADLLGERVTTKSTIGMEFNLIPPRQILNGQSIG